MKYPTIPNYTLLFIGSLFLWPLGCIKNLDQPPLNEGTNVQATIAIRTLRDGHIPGNTERLIDNQIITGIVTANDANDNFYKTIVIQDSTAAITIRLDGFGLAADYPLGKRLFIRLNGLFLGEYGGMLQLGGGVDKTNPSFPELLPIPSPLFAKVIAIGNQEKMPEPLLVKFEQLKDTMQGRLIEIDSVELAPSDTAKPFADYVNKETVSHTLRICNGGSLYLRTSGFASFAAVKTPRGNGRIKGIYTVFGSQKQLLIRDTADVQLEGLRCSGNGPRILFYEDFENIPINNFVQINAWKNIAETGSQFFLGKMVSNNRYAEISAFATAQPAIATWLVLPPINLNSSSSEQLSFLTKDAFDNGAVLQVYISTNHDGGSQPWKARWTVLKSTIAKGSVNSIATKWTQSGKVSLSSYNGTVYIAFKYQGNDLPGINNKKTTAFQLDEIKIVGN
ncbi:MAG: hypothetical protein FD136_529 [Chitinophagaceae bacterium]|nr:MAG: hypothetical protein FD136_529 [Chitinophagaceae bacterium]